MAATRCPDCNKFATIEADNEPVVSDEEYDQESGRFTAAVRMVNECADCGHELLEANFDLELDFSETLLGHDCPEKETGTGWTAEVVRQERKVREHPPTARVRTKYYGVEVDVELTCNCEEKITKTLTFTDEIKASQMDSVV